jgi:hypothetical protein
MRPLIKYGGRGGDLVLAVQSEKVLNDGKLTAGLLATTLKFDSNTRWAVFVAQSPPTGNEIFSRPATPQLFLLNFRVFRSQGNKFILTEQSLMINCSRSG